MGRPREKEPDTSTTAGLFAAYLAHVIEKRGLKVDDVAESSGIARSTIYNWLGAEGDPSLSQIDDLAKSLGFNDAWALKPPRSFIDSLPKKKK